MRPIIDIPTFALLFALAIPTAPGRAIDGALDLSLQGTGTFNGMVPTLDGAVALTFDDQGRPVMGYTRIYAGTDRDLQLSVVHDQGPAAACNLAIDLGGTNDDRLYALARGGGQIYLVGKAAGSAADPKDRLVIGRMNPSSCAPDPQFGGGGKLVIGYDGWLAGRALAVTPEGRLRVAVDLKTSPLGSSRLLSLGFHANGSGDGTFATQIVDFATAYGATGFEPTAMARQKDGKIVVVGAVKLGNGDLDVGVARFHPNGGLDTSFSLDGLASFSFEIVDLAYADYPTAVAVVPDGRIAIAGVVSRSPSERHAAVAILTPSGGYDNGFGVIGRYVFDYGEPDESSARALAVAGNRLVVVGHSGVGGSSNTDFGVARLLTSGSSPLDSSFGAGGRTTIAFDIDGPNFDIARAVAIDPRGRIVVGGLASNGTTIFPVVARLQSSYLFADGFERFGTAAWSAP